jgi:DNA-3-methyladenine glycosylase I
MAQPFLYCDFVKDLSHDNLHKIYHDHHYGYSIEDENELFGRLILEINQAGLSWDIILKKQENFKTTYDNFDIKTIANYGEEDRQRLLNDAGIIRNKLKIDASSYNANEVLKIQNKFGSFKAWIDHYKPLSKNEWVKLFKKHFKFVGGEIVGEFLTSIGVLEGAHKIECPSIVS